MRVENGRAYRHVFFCVERTAVRVAATGKVVILPRRFFRRSTRPASAGAPELTPELDGLLARLPAAQ